MHNSTTVSSNEDKHVSISASLILEWTQSRYSLSYDIICMFIKGTRRTIFTVVHSIEDAQYQILLLLSPSHFSVAQIHGDARR